MRRRHRHQFLDFGRQCTVLENHLIPVHKALEQVGLELAQLAQALDCLFGKKLSHCFLPSWPEIRSPRKSHIILRFAVTSWRDTQGIRGSWLYTQHLRRAA